LSLVPRPPQRMTTGISDLGVRGTVIGCLLLPVLALSSPVLVDLLDWVAAAC